MTEVRALICSPSDHNRTILLSSHILREFEKVFDIFTIITDGVLGPVGIQIALEPQERS